LTDLKEFRRLFHYDAWANREVIQSWGPANTPTARSLQLMTHVLWGERLWWGQLHQLARAPKPTPEFTATQCAVESGDLARLWEGYLASADGSLLTQTVAYTNSKGENWTNSVHDILTHVVMHSAYHRGQIAADMRAAGKVPAYTDFIHAVRQGLVEE
jgi:uncharacterized damage-inducible protein DinB